MQKIKLLIPDLLTGLNICIGCICFILIMQVPPAKLAPHSPGALHPNYIVSAWLIVIAGLIDILDGAIARWLRKTGAFGIEFDSIADFTAFAIAPGMLIYACFYRDQSIFFIIVLLLYVVCAAYRLARFNTSALQTSRTQLMGLGAPISAIIVVAVILLIAELHETGAIREISWTTRAVITGLIIINSLLMVLPIEFITAYEYCFRNIRRIILLLTAIFAPLLLLRFRLPALSILLVGILYIAESLGRALVRKRSSATSSKS